MSIIADLKSLNKQARNAIIASYLGWTLDAFDFFILVFVLKDVAATFGTSIKSVTLAITLTLAFRPVGALIFGQLADRLGRRPALMVNILIYSVVECLSGFAPSLTAFIVLRAIYGIAMGGEWGVGASLVLESVPARLRGLVSGILQAGYPSGYFLASPLFLVLPIIPFWVGAQTVYGLAASAFLIQFFAQGAWGVVPVHLNEISPQEIRGTFPGFAYQMGNLLAAYNATLQADFAERHHGAYGEALSLIAAAAAAAVLVLSLLGYEARGRIFGAGDDAPLKRDGK